MRLDTSAEYIKKIASGGAPEFFKYKALFKTFKLNFS
jgi:hypothetical protein